MALTSQRKKELLLGAILALLAAALWKNLGGPPGAGGAAGGPGGGRASDISGLRVFPVDWAALQAPRPQYDPSGRNIFQFGAIPPPPPPKLTPEEEAAIREAHRKAEEERQRQLELQRQQAEEAARLAQQQAQAQQNLPPPPPPKPVPPAIPYKFIGYIGPPEGKIAVLHDGSDLLFARSGDHVGKGFRILEIGYESIKFGYTDPRFKGESQTLPMSSSY
jgi:hypothetical protein